MRPFMLKTNRRKQCLQEILVAFSPEYLDRIKITSFVAASVWKSPWDKGYCQKISSGHPWCFWTGTSPTALVYCASLVGRRQTSSLSRIKSEHSGACSIAKIVARIPRFIGCLANKHDYYRPTTMGNICGPKSHAHWHQSSVASMCDMGWEIVSKRRC